VFGWHVGLSFELPVVSVVGVVHVGIVQVVELLVVVEAVVTGGGEERDGSGLASNDLTARCTYGGPRAPNSPPRPASRHFCSGDAGRSAARLRSAAATVARSSGVGALASEHLKRA
jgi:hypothetical protein